MKNPITDPAKAAQEYRKTVYKCELHPTQIRELDRAFVAGMLHTLTILLSVAGLPENDSEQAIAKLHADIMEFAYSEINQQINKN